MKLFMTFLASSLVSLVLAQVLPSFPGLSIRQESGWLLTDTSVQHALQITPSELHAINDGFNAYAQTEQQAFAKGTASATDLRTLSGHTARGLLKILTPDQRERLFQIAIQLRGPAALRDGEVQARVGLSQAQANKIEAIYARKSESDRAFGEHLADQILKEAPGSDPTWEARRKAIILAANAKRGSLVLAQRKRDQEALGILTPTQMKVWKDLQGAAYVRDIKHVHFRRMPAQRIPPHSRN